MVQRYAGLARVEAAARVAATKTNAPPKRRVKEYSVLHTPYIRPYRTEYSQLSFASDNTCLGVNLVTGCDLVTLLFGSPNAQ